MGVVRGFIGRHRVVTGGLCVLAALLGIAAALYAALGHGVIEKAYYGRAPLGLNRLIEDRGRPLRAYLDYGDDLYGRLHGYLFAALAVWFVFLLYALAREIPRRRPRFFAVQAVGIVAALTFVELFLRYTMPVKIGEITFENFRASSNPKIVLEPRPLAGEFNADGFRDYDYSTEKPEGVYRILVAGDSLAYGFRVNREDTYAKRLERMLNEGAGNGLKYEVINMGVPGYRTVQIVERLKEKGLEYDPDMVIYGYWLDDITYSGFTPFSLSSASVNVSETIQAMMTASPLERAVKRLLLSSQIVRRFIFIIRERQMKAQTTEKTIGVSGAEARVRPPSPEVTALYEEYLSGVRSGRLKDLPGFEPYYEEYARRADFEVWNDGMRELAEACRAGTIRCVLLVTPVLYDYEEGNYNWGELHGFIGKIAASHSIPTIDLQKEFGRYAASRVRAGDMEHPNAMGHEIIATSLYEWIVETGDR